MIHMSENKWKSAKILSYKVPFVWNNKDNGRETETQNIFVTRRAECYSVLDAMLGKK